MPPFNFNERSDLYSEAFLSDTPGPSFLQTLETLAFSERPPPGDPTKDALYLYAVLTMTSAQLNSAMNFLATDPGTPEAAEALTALDTINRMYEVVANAVPDGWTAKDAFLRLTQHLTNHA